MFCLFSMLDKNELDQEKFILTKSTVTVKINLKNLQKNFKLLQKNFNQHLMPVIKADAYGHGVLACAKALAQEKDIILAVGAIAEAALLRDNHITCSILALLGPIEHNDYQLVLSKKIIPLISSPEQLEILSKIHAKNTKAQTPEQNNPANIPIALKFDTGMGRLGFNSDNIDNLLNFLQKNIHIKPILLISHLAVADEDEGLNFSLEQKNLFEQIIKKIKTKYPEIKASLGNSAALLAHPDLHFDLVRPGLALYGANPVQACRKLMTKQYPKLLEPVMEVCAPIIQIHELKARKSISYGRTFIAEKDMKVAIIGIGYANGYSRGLSNKAEMLICGRRVPVLGRVCMQLTAVDVSHIPEITMKDKAFILGGEGRKAIYAEELSKWWGTIPYEVFCLLGSLNKREFFNLKKKTIHYYEKF